VSWFFLTGLFIASVVIVAVTQDVYSANYNLNLTEMIDRVKEADVIAIRILLIVLLCMLVLGGFAGFLWGSWFGNLIAKEFKADLREVIHETPIVIRRAEEYPQTPIDRVN
jgi:nitrate/nitrite transporter NarK